MNQQSMCVVKERDAELPPAVLEVRDQDQIQYGLTDCQTTLQKLSLVPGWVLRRMWMQFLGTFKR